MAPPLSKKEIRRNPLAEWVGGGIRFTQLHQRAILVSAIALLIILAGVGGYSWYRMHQAQQARAALVAAEDALRGEKPGAPPNLDEAIKRLGGVANQYRGTEGAEEALIRLANMEYDAGKLDEAGATYSDYLATYPRGRFVLLAAIGKAYADEAKGNYQAGAATLSQALDSAKSSPLAGEAYSDLARLYEEMKKPEEALRVYNQIIEKYGQTYWGQQALQRIAALKPK